MPDFAETVYTALASANDGIVTKYVVITESMDQEGEKWLTTHAYDAASEPLTDWDYKGLVHAALNDTIHLTVVPEDDEDDDDFILP